MVDAQDGGVRFRIICTCRCGTYRRGTSHQEWVLAIQKHVPRAQVSRIGYMAAVSPTNSTFDPLAEHVLCARCGSQLFTPLRDCSECSSQQLEKYRCSKEGKLSNDIHC